MENLNWSYFIAQYFCVNRNANKASLYLYLYASGCFVQMKNNKSLALYPGIFLYPAAPCLVTQRFFFEIATAASQACIKTKVTAPPTVPTNRAEVSTADEANKNSPSTNNCVKAK